jgi:chorismate mutase-like protein
MIAIPCIWPARAVLHLAALLAAILVSAGSAGASTGTLFSAVNERLSFMQAVAAWKADNNRPVEDLEREKVVLEAARKQAAEIGLSADSVTLFFQAQIDAAKDIQFCWIARWKEGTARPDSVPDLVQDVRPALLKLGNDILQELATTSVAATDRAAFDVALTVDCLSESARKALFDGLLGINP